MTLVQTRHVRSRSPRGSRLVSWVAVVGVRKGSRLVRPCRNENGNGSPLFPHYRLRCAVDARLSIRRSPTMRDSIKRISRAQWHYLSHKRASKRDKRRGRLGLGPFPFGSQTERERVDPAVIGRPGAELHGTCLAPIPAGSREVERGTGHRCGPLYFGGRVRVGGREGVLAPPVEVR